MQTKPNSLHGLTLSDCLAAAGTDVPLSKMPADWSLWFHNMQGILRKAIFRTEWVAIARQIVSEHFQGGFCDQRVNVWKLPAQLMISHPQALKFSKLWSYSQARYNKLYRNYRKCTSIKLHYNFKTQKGNKKKLGTWYYGCYDEIGWTERTVAFLRLNIENGCVCTNAIVAAVVR